MIVDDDANTGAVGTVEAESFVDDSVVSDVDTNAVTVDAG